MIYVNVWLSSFLQTVFLSQSFFPSWFPCFLCIIYFAFTESNDHAPAPRPPGRRRIPQALQKTPKTISKTVSDRLHSLLSLIGKRNVFTLVLLWLLMKLWGQFQLYELLQHLSQWRLQLMCIFLKKGELVSTAQWRSSASQWSLPKGGTKQ